MAERGSRAVAHRPRALKAAEYEYASGCSPAAGIASCSSRSAEAWSPVAAHAERAALKQTRSAGTLAPAIISSSRSAAFDCLAAPAGASRGRAGSALGKAEEGQGGVPLMVGGRQCTPQPEMAIEKWWALSLSGSCASAWLSRATLDFHARLLLKAMSSAA